MIFDSDDNDNDLSFDGKPRKVSPASSLPTRPASKSPFGSSGDQGNQSSLPPRKPAAPFGSQGTPTSRPQRPIPAEKINAPVPPVERRGAQVQPPFSKPVAPKATEQAKAAPVLPDLSSYIPPRNNQQQSYEAPPTNESEVANESELYLRNIKEEAERRRVEQMQPEQVPAYRDPAMQTFTPPVNYEQQQPMQQQVPPAFQQQQQVPPTFQQQPMQTAPQQTTTGKKGKNKKPKGAPVAKANKPVKENKYAGERKKILYIRIVAGSVAAIIAVAGMKAIFVGDTGPTKEMVMSAAQEAVNYTGFPTASGEQFSIDFARAYLNFNSEDGEVRTESLQRFASPELVKQIDIATLSPAEYAAVQKAGASYSDYKVAQNVTYGPYVVAANNLDEKSAVFTVKAGLETGTVVYLDVPVKYDPDNFSLTLAGPPSFSKPIQNQGEAKKDEWTSTFDGGGDDEVEKALQSDLEAYLSAWALSDETIINRYSLESATPNAKRGLQSSVRFKEIISLQVEPQSDERPSTATSRRVEVNVLWEDPVTNLRYPQQYRMLIGLNPEGKWAIYDIENFSVLN